MADASSSEFGVSVEIENPNKNIDKITTSKGSEYKYLIDGKIQRFKKATGEVMAPQDVLVFIPPYESLKGQEYWSKYLQEKGINDQNTYERVLLDFTRPGKTILVTNKEGNEINSNNSAYEIKGRGQGVYIQLIDKSGGNYDQKYFFPVSVAPKVGWLTFDTRRYEENGKKMHEKHIGNSVVEIGLKKPGNAFTKAIEASKGK